MNTRFRFLVRTAVQFAFCALIVPCHGQERDGTLTTGFDALSSKERSKIAALENKEAPEDKAYQIAMSDAEHAFQEGRYDQAMESYGAARKLRPYNVYPKVKMEDLQALITKEAIAKAANTPPIDSSITAAEPSLPKPLVMTVSDTFPVPVSAVPSAVMAAPMVETAVDGAVDPNPIAIKGRPHATAVTARPSSLESAPKPQVGSPTAPKAVGERSFMEAGAAVLERTVYEADRLVVYRRVAHKWGQVFYFKENHSITEREWKDRFE